MFGFEKIYPLKSTIGDFSKSFSIFCINSRMTPCRIGSIDFIFAVVSTLEVNDLSLFHLFPWLKNKSKLVAFSWSNENDAFI